MKCKRCESIEHIAKHPLGFYICAKCWKAERREAEMRNTE